MLNRCVPSCLAAIAWCFLRISRCLIFFPLLNGFPYTSVLGQRPRSGEDLQQSRASKYRSDSACVSSSVPIYRLRACFAARACLSPFTYISLLFACSVNCLRPLWSCLTASSGPLQACGNGLAGSDDRASNWPFVTHVPVQLLVVFESEPCDGCFLSLYSNLPSRLLRILLMLGADLFLAPGLPLPTLNTEPYCSSQAPGFLWPRSRPPETSLFQPQGAYEGHSDLLQALMLFDWLRYEHPPFLQPSPDPLPLSSVSSTVMTLSC
ncbi:hypothetical protein KC367_g153 [Hortaea werneckii]|nr:hypothetical protein KC367_g153 [Hortaea werneckii]